MDSVQLAPRRAAHWFDWVGMSEAYRILEIDEEERTTEFVWWRTREGRRRIRRIVHVGVQHVWNSCSVGHLICYCRKKTTR